MFRTTNALGDHMVLQRDTEVRIWGKGDRKDDIVTVKFGAYEADGFVNKHLEWLVILPPMAVNTVPQEMTITCNDEKIVYTDILVGDVWVVNGQSNAEATVTYASDAGGGIYEKEMDDIPENIRIVNQRRVFAIDNPEAMKKPQFDMLNIEETSWRRLETRKNLESMSAIGYFFARKIAKTLNSSIPLGIINVSSGGSPMMELIMPEFIEPMNYTAPEKKEIPLAGIYNAMLAPIQKMAIMRCVLKDTLREVTV